MMYYANRLKKLVMDKGSIVKQKTDGKKMIVESIYKEDFCDLTGTASKGDLECVYWDNNCIMYKTLSPSEVEFIKNTRNEDFAVGDEVILKSGSKVFVIDETNGNNVHLCDTSIEYDKAIFKKVRQTSLSKLFRKLKDSFSNIVG